MSALTQARRPATWARERIDATPAPRALLAGGVLLFLILTAVYVFAVRSLSVNSDQATVLLQAHAMAHGNPLLHDWHVPSDNFLTLTLAVYAVAERFTGMTPTLLRVVPAAIYALMVCAMVLLTMSGAPRRQAVIAGAVTFVLLALPSAAGPYAGAQVILTEHVLTVAAVAASLLLFRSSVDTVTGLPRSGSRWFTAGAVVSFLLLTITVLGDPFSLFLVVIPAVVFGVFEAARRNAVRHHLSLAAWAAGAAVLGTLAGVVISRAGGFTEVPPLVHLAVAGQLPSKVGLFFTYLSEVTGSYVWGQSIRDPQTLFGLVRMAAAILLLAAVARTLIRWVRGVEPDSLSVLLSLSVLAIALAVVVSDEFASGTQRYLMLLVIMGTPVLARRFAAWTAVVRPPAWVAGGLAAVLTVACLGSFAPALRNHWMNPYPQLASWLQQRGLTVGVGDFWYAAMLNAYSRGSVDALSVFSDGHTLIPQRFLSDIRWFTATPSPASGQWFAFWPQTGGRGGVGHASAEAAFGAPAASYTVDGFRVETWSHDIVQDTVQAYLSGGPATEPVMAQDPQPI